MNNQPNLKSLNNNPVAKLAYLKQLLSTPKISSQQQARIYQLIQQTELEISRIPQPPPPMARASPTGQTNQFNQAPQNHQLQQTMSVMNTTRMGTRDLTSNGRALVAKEQVSNMKTLTASYTSDEARMEAEFELEIQRKREAFRAEQQRRRMEYMNKLRELEQGNTDSLKIFGLGPNYNLEELKLAYKRLAMETHPDRPGGNTERFQLVTKCYMSLLERLKEKTAGTDNQRANEQRMAAAAAGMREESTDLYRTGNKGFKGGAATVSGKLDPNPKSFNRELFNKLYEQNKLWDPNDDGYDDWLRKGDVDESSRAPPVFSKSFNLSVFNSTFEDWKEQQAQALAANGQIVRTDHPMELIKTGVGYSMLDGGQTITDFTKSMDQPGLQYTDLKLAYAGGCGVINPRDVERRAEYRSIDELERERSRISYQMSPEDMAREEAKARMLAQEEEQRRARMREHAELVTNHYTNTHQSMLGYAPSSESDAAKLRLAYSAAESGQNPALTYQPMMPASTDKNKLKQIGFSGRR
jgi:hypothetical protein